MFFKSDKDKAADKLKDAQEYFKQQRYSDGLKLLYEASKLDPENIESFYMLGRGEQVMMNNLGAITAYEQVVRLNPADHEAFARMAACYLELHRFEEGTQAIQKAFAIFKQQNQNPPKPYGDVANCLLMFKARKEAETEFKNNPMSPVRLDNHPEALAKFKELQQSQTLQLNDIDNLLAEYPNIPDLCFWRASLVINFGMVEVAMRDFTRMILLEPSLKSPYIERAKLWMSITRFAEALADTDEVVKLEANNPEAIVLRAMIFGAKGDTLAANRENEKLLSIDLSQYPEPRILLQQANVFFQHKRWDDAIRTYGQILARPNLPKDVAANTYYSQGKLLMNLQRQSEAVDSASKAVELMPNVPDFCHILGEAGKQSGRKADEIRGWEAYVAAVKAGAQGFLPLYVAENFLREAQSKA